MAAPSDTIEQYIPGSELPLSPNLFNQIQIQSDCYKQELKKCQKQFDSSDTIQYYLLSTKFIKQWTQLVERINKSGQTSENIVLKMPHEMNDELIKTHLDDFGEYQIKKDLQEGVDYQFVSKQVMQIFQLYKGPRIPRRGYFHGIQKLVQLHPVKFEFIYMSDAVLKQLRNLQQAKSFQRVKIYSSLAYKNEKVSDLLYRLTQYRKKSALADEIQSDQARIYAAQQYFTIQRFVKELRDTENKEKQYMQLPGDELRKDMIIGDLNIPPDHQPIMIVQLRSKKWIYSPPRDNQKKDRCEFCRRYTVLNYACRCKEVEYCSQRCLQSDYKYHVSSCEKVMQEQNQDPKFQRTPKSKYGLVGLNNIGNTCYMNSALQCLQHTKDLSGYFSSKSYLQEINQENPIGSKGRIVRSYAKFIDSILTTTQDSIAPSKLKFNVGKVKQMFMGYEQHDSQQFLLFMLDTLHQDLNRVKNKPYTSGVENDDRPDSQVAKQSWFVYLKRNQSYINDLMGGQYRSQVKCPDCKVVSVTFDPFLIFSVPIPTNQAKSINIYYFYSNYQKSTLKMTISSKNNVVKQLRQDASNKAQVDLEQTKFFILGFNGPIRQVSDTQTVDRIINEKQFHEGGQQRQLFGLQFSQQELQDLETKKYLTFKFLSDPQNPKTLTFKRPFPFCCKKLKGSNLFDRICRFLLMLYSKSPAEVEKQEMQKKYIVFREKSIAKQMFKIHMVYGNLKQTMNSIQYEKTIEIKQETNVEELLEANKYQVQFEVVFKQKPSFEFNTFKSCNKQDPFDYYSSKPGSQQRYTLQECLHEMKKPQQLVQGNQVFCSKCQDLKLAEKTMQMYKASKYLVIQLRRFKQIGYQKSKNYANIEFPLQLDLKDDVIDPTVPQTYFMNCKNQQQYSIFLKPKYWKGFNKSNCTKYRLYAVVNHHGTLTGGHYTALAKNGQKWYEFDDSRVSQIQQTKIATPAAYLLFYERTDMEDQWPPLQIVEPKQEQTVSKQNTQQTMIQESKTASETKQKQS